MSTSVWGIAVSVFFALIGLFVPIPEEWKLGLFVASVVGFIASCCGWIFAYRRERRASQPQVEKYYDVLRELAEKKKQKASDEDSGGYSILTSIAADARQRSRDEALKPKPNLIAQFRYVGIYGMAGGAGITVRLEIRNTGTPSIADKFTATLSSDGFSDELFPAPMPPNASYADETGGMKTIKPSETLYQKLRQPIQSGNRVIGFLFYFAKGVSPAQLTAREPTEIVIRFRDVTFREYSVSSEGVKPLYPPGVVDQFTAFPDTEEANATSLNAKIEQVRFFDTWEGSKPYLLMLVLVLVKNTGAPTAVGGWRLSFKSPDINADGFKPAGREADRHLGDGVTLYKKDSLIEKLDLNPVSPGTPVRGWLDYYLENKKLSDLLGKPFEMEISFQDTFDREGTAKVSGVAQNTGGPAGYFPGVEPLQAQIAPVVKVKSPMEVIFDNTACLIVRVINHDPDRDAKIKSVAVLGINIYGEEKQILSTKVPNDPSAIAGGWRLGSISLPYSLAPRDAQNFETLILECNLGVYAHAGYFAEVTLQTGEKVRSEIQSVTPRESAIPAKPAGSPEANPLRPIEIRDRIDGFIESGNPVLARWKGDNDALLTDEIQRESLRWLADITAFAKKHLSLEQNDKLKDFRVTLTPQEKWPVSHRLAQAGMDPNTFYVAYEMGYKLKLLEKFRDDCSSV